MKIPFHLLAALTGAGCLSAYELHEWGTFTTVSGSDGALLAGLQREEEALPPFVHSHFGFENGQFQSPFLTQKLLDRHGKLWPLNQADGEITGKGFGRRPVSGVTVKMETPVIYFHSDKGFRAKVNVGFNGGSVSQWYPKRSGGETLPLPPAPTDPRKSPTPAAEWLVDFSKPYRGEISWDVEVLSPAESKQAITFKARDTVNWMRARIPEANAVRSGAETEGYLFYRGIGNFNPGLETKVDANETLYLRNRTGADIPYLLVYESRAGIVSWRALDKGLAAAGSHEITSAEMTPEPMKAEILPAGNDDGNSFPVFDSFNPDVYRSLRAALVRTGLLDSEANAMIQTWWTSYFEKEGLRIFWILPRRTTDGILPLTVEPAPEKIVRVIVGRSEIFRPGEERVWAWNAARKMPEADRSAWEDMIRRDRFGLAIRQRVQSLQATPAETSGLPR